MGQNIAEKILSAHLVEGDPQPGNPVTIKIDQTLTQDATGTMAYLQFEALGKDRVETELSVSYVDHNTIQDGFENADDHRYLQSVAEKFGVVFSRPGNGICHQVHLERFGVPGKTLLGSDSHTPTGGGIGMIAIGAGGLDVALAMAGKPFAITWPKVIEVRLTGELRPWVAAKDVILHLLSILSTKGNVGCLVEYTGPGVKTLSAPQRATITNMGAELGVTTSVFPSDEITKAFLEAQGRGDVWSELAADADATYDRTIEIDLSQVECLTAGPHSPDNILAIKDLVGQPVNQVCIGSCTNSSYRDLMVVAELLKGKTIHPKTGLVIAPGSRQVMEMIARNGALGDMVAAGARIAESACGFCIGMGMAPNTEAVSLRTSNRNFKGRSGTADANVYLVSPEVATLAALKGEWVNPLDGGEAFPAVEEPSDFLINDEMLVAPPADGSQVEILRGPNIGDPPNCQRLPDTLAGDVTLKVGDKITTDHIMPAGSRLKYRSNIPAYSEFVFEGVDTTFPARCREKRDAGTANIVVASESYGQGSSREHAAICPMFLGVRAVIAKGIERIHAANLINFGILPLLFEDGADYDGIDQEDRLEIADLHTQVNAGGAVTVNNVTQGTSFTVTPFLTEKNRPIVLAGGRLAFERDNG
ncbi:MAG: aconitate hydratase [Planctomycetota bacterium]|jgi:aconitate hydratase